MASNIPIPTAEANKEDPPYEIKGKVIPLVGIKCKVEAMLIMPCSPKEAANPADA